LPVPAATRAGFNLGCLGCRRAGDGRLFRRLDGRFLPTVNALLLLWLPLFHLLLRHLRWLLPLLHLLLLRLLLPLL